jgi:hypothetical protein
MGRLWEEAGWRWVPWYGGGGAGCERPNQWGYPNGHGTGTCGGGGEVGSAGRANSGGGGGGGGYMGPEFPHGATGPAGGSGIGIIRIRTRAEKLVQYPVVIGYEDVWDPLDEVWVHTPIYPEGISVKRLPEEQTHTDLRGEEVITYWGWPDPAKHDQNFPP